MKYEGLDEQDKKKVDNAQVKPMTMKDLMSLGGGRVVK